MEDLNRELSERIALHSQANARFAKAVFELGYNPKGNLRFARNPQEEELIAAEEELELRQWEIDETRRKRAMRRREMATG